MSGPSGILAGAVGGDSGSTHAGDGRAGAGKAKGNDLLNNVPWRSWGGDDGEWSLGRSGEVAPVAGDGWLTKIKMVKV